MEDKWPKAVSQLCERGLLELQGSRLYATLQGMDVLNTVLLEFMD
jgi:hypothetical protein